MATLLYRTRGYKRVIGRSEIGEAKKLMVRQERHCHLSNFNLRSDGRYTLRRNQQASA